MKLSTKIAVVALAVGALGGIGAEAASAATPTSAPSHGAGHAQTLTQGFTFTNNSGRPIRYIDSYSTDGGLFDSGPSNGTIVQSGGSLTWQQDYEFLANTHETMEFQPMDGGPSGANVFEWYTDVNAANKPSSQYVPDDQTALIGSASNHGLVVTDAPAYTRAFHIDNSSSREFQLSEIEVVNTPGWVDSGPAVNTILQPASSPTGTNQDFTIAYVPGIDQEVDLYYQELNPSTGDPNGRSFFVEAMVDANGVATSEAPNTPPMNVTVDAGGQGISVVDKG